MTRLGEAHRCLRKERRHCRADSSPALDGWRQPVPPGGPQRQDPGTAARAGRLARLALLQAEGGGFDGEWFRCERSC